MIPKVVGGQKGMTKIIIEREEAVVVVVVVVVTTMMNHGIESVLREKLLKVSWKKMDGWPKLRMW